MSPYSETLVEILSWVLLTNFSLSPKVTSYLNEVARIPTYILAVWKDSDLTPPTLPSRDVMTVLFTDEQHKCKNVPIVLHKHVIYEYSGNLSHKLVFL